MELLEINYRKPQSKKYREGLAARMAATKELPAFWEIPAYFYMPDGSRVIADKKPKFKHPE